VPPGFTITTEVCTHYYANGNSYPKDTRAQVEAALAEVGRITGKTFGDKAIRCWCRCARARAPRCPA
jgi:pyruvate,orthophosphate dikinase